MAAAINETMRTYHYDPAELDTPAYKRVEASVAALAETTTQLEVVENTDEVHHMVVCTLCSCYPSTLLGRPPDWYKSLAYRSRAVTNPRGVMREFGLNVAEEVKVRVGKHTIVHIQGTKLYKVRGEDSLPLARSEFPVKGRISARNRIVFPIVIRPGAEKTVYVEASYYSSCDLIIRGRLRNQSR